LIRTVPLTVANEAPYIGGPCGPSAREGRHGPRCHRKLKGACHIAGLPAVSVLQELPPQPAESEAGVDHDVADDNPEEEPQRPPQGWRRHWTAAPHWPVTWRSERAGAAFGAGWRGVRSGLARRSERAGAAFGFVRAAPAPLHDTLRLAVARRMALDHSSGDGEPSKTAFTITLCFEHRSESSEHAGHIIGDTNTRPRCHPHAEPQSVTDQGSPTRHTPSNNLSNYGIGRAGLP